MQIDGKTVAHIEKAMGFDLYDNQKAYLWGLGGLVGGRASGKTTAYCIKLALSEGPPLDMRIPESFSDTWSLANHRQYSRQFFRDQFMEIRQKLKDYGFKVRDIKGIEEPMPVSDRKHEVIRRLESMGYMIRQDSYRRDMGAFTVALRTRNGYMVTMTVLEEDLEYEHIVDHIVARINEFIIKEL